MIVNLRYNWDKQNNWNSGSWNDRNNSNANIRWRLMPLLRWTSGCGANFVRTGHKNALIWNLCCARVNTQQWCLSCAWIIGSYMVSYDACVMQTNNVVAEERHKYADPLPCLLHNLNNLWCGMLLSALHACTQQIACTACMACHCASARMRFVTRSGVWECWSCSRKTHTQNIVRARADALPSLQPNVLCKTLDRRHKYTKF